MFTLFICRIINIYCDGVIDNILYIFIQDQIKEFTQDKERHRHECQRAIRKLQEIRKSIQCTTGELEIQERATKKAVSNATEKCPRINTTRLALQNDTICVIKIVFIYFKG